MALESGNFIPELVETNPDGTDLASTLDDHDRLIKRCVKGSFPNFVGTTGVPKSVSLTEDQINDAARKGASNVFIDQNTFNVGGKSALDIDDPDVNGVSTWDLNGDKHKVGFRDPLLDTKAVNYTLLQSDEGNVLQTTANNVSFTVDTLAPGTCVTIFVTTFDGTEILRGAGLTNLRWMSGGSMISGAAFDVVRGSVVQIYYSSAATAWLWGNGISEP